MKIRDWYKLIKAEYPKARFIEAENPDLVDDSIEITDTIHVQLANGGHAATVVQENPDGTFTFKPIRGDVKKVLNDLKEIIH